MLYLNLFLAAAIVFMTAGGQVLLKMGANSSGNLIFNPYVMGGYSMFVAVMFMSAILLRSIDLKYFTVIISLNYLVATIASAYFLKETFTARKLIACLVITLGAAIFSL